MRSAVGAGTQVAGQVRGPSGEEGRQGRGLLCHRHDNAILSFPDPPNRLYMPAGQHRSGLPDHPCAMLVLTMPLTMPLPHHPESLSVNLPAPAPPPLQRSVLPTWTPLWAWGATCRPHVPAHPPPWPATAPPWPPRPRLRQQVRGWWSGQAGHTAPSRYTNPTCVAKPLLP